MRMCARIAKLEDEMAARPFTEKDIKEAFALIVAAAIKGDRCPQCEPHGDLRAQAMPALYRRGMIRGEISGHNWRQVTILKGRHKGKKTAPHPHGAPTWKIVDTNGSHRPEDFRPQEYFRKRSAPRPLPREELER